MLPKSLRDGVAGLTYAKQRVTPLLAAVLPLVGRQGATHNWAKWAVPWFRIVSRIVESEPGRKLGTEDSRSGWLLFFSRFALLVVSNCLFWA